MLIFSSVPQGASKRPGKRKRKERSPWAFSGVQVCHTAYINGGHQAPGWGNAGCPQTQRGRKTK